MRLIKAQTTNNRTIYGKGIRYDIDEQVIIDSDNAVLISKGTDLQKPGTPVNGHVRYNTTNNEFEFYSNNSWRVVRYKEPTTITKQTLGFGDDTETVFGPLDSGDTDYPVPISADNLLVLIENVLQISTTNYTLEQSASGSLTGPNQPYADGWYIKFTSPPPSTGSGGGTVPITVYHNFDK